MKDSSDPRRQIVKASRASSIGLEFAMTSLAGLGGGYWLDKTLDTNPVFTLGGFILGVCAGFWSLYKAVKQMNDEMDKEESS
ncbi:MAG: AtpZ/AtpI family protein [Myxococcota bacterium]|nr:AtpZ/AtpI family protein [Myxococcota bacterium]